ncbi:ABC transporter ATP-binding protein [Planctomycetota bacterium]
MHGHGHNGYIAEDEILGKAYDHQLMKRMLGYVRPYWWALLLGVILVFLATGVFLAGPRLIGMAIDLGIKPKDPKALGRIALIYLVVVIMSRWVFGFISAYVLAYLGQKTMYDLRMQLFSHLQKMSLRFFDKNPVGRLVTRVSNDINVLSEMVSVGLVTVFGDIFLLGGLIIAMLWLNTRLALMVFATAIILVPITFYFQTKIRRAWREIRKKLARINAYINENVMGIRVTKLFNREDQNFEKFKTINQEHFQAAYDSVYYHALFVPFVTVLGAVAVGLVLYYGGGDVIQDHIELGALVAFISYTMHFFEPVRDLADKYHIFQAAMSSAERVFGLLDTPEEIKNQAVPVKIEDIKGALEFDSVSFAYDDKNYVLKNVSFKVAPGEHIALVGITGGGKSTVINLLSRFYDIKQGRILLDGVDIKEMSQQDLRRSLGIVLQDVFLFSGNIMQNIRLGEKDISLKRVEEVAHYVNAHTFIDHLPNGYFSRVEERGVTLSAGQRQLLSFARALVFDPRILILDEATSSVDLETERYIQDAIKKLIQGRTAVIIAHRLSTIQNVDRIFVVHQGEIKERGSHQELLKKRGLYYKLYQMQYQMTKTS